jgi:hypothetical protein
MSNLLSKDPLITASGQAEVYVVYDNKDYRMSLATLITLVTKQSLGLDKVNNTTDSEKPVSSATAYALATKASVENVPTIEAFNLLAGSLSNLVTQAQLNQAISSVVSSLNNYQTAVQVSQAIEQAVTPINLAISTLSGSLNEQIQKISNLQNASTGYASKERVVALENQLTTTDQTLAALSLSFDTHAHRAEDIEGLTELVASMIEEAGTIVIGPNQW